MKFGPVTKFDKWNIKTSKKKISGDVISSNYDAIVIFPIYDWFGAIRKVDSGGMVCNFCIFININLLSYKN